MAQDLLKRGKKVILAGRTESSLKETTQAIGATAYYVLDTGDTASIPDFISRITADHPDLDCIINNAGVQRPFQIFGPDYTFDLAKADAEVNINIRGPMHLIVGLMPHFEKKDKAVIMNVSSVLGFVPFSVVNPVYNGTKAWLHSFTVNLRTQCAASDRGKGIKVVEIAPPAVETDLHRERIDPDDNKKDKLPISLSIEEFMEEVRRDWEGDKDIISPGIGKEVVADWDKTMGERYRKMAQK